MKLRAYTCWVNGQDMAFTVYALDAHHARLVIARAQEVDYFMVGARLEKVEKKKLLRKEEMTWKLRLAGFIERKTTCTA